MNLDFFKINFFYYNQNLYNKIKEKFIFKKKDIYLKFPINNLLKIIYKIKIILYEYFLIEIINFLILKSVKLNSNDSFLLV